MLDYEWGNPAVMLSSDNEPQHVAGSDPNRQQHQSNFFDHYSNSQAAAAVAYNNLVGVPQPPPSVFGQPFNPSQAQHQLHFYDPQTYAGASAYPPPHHHHTMIQMDPFHNGGAQGHLLVPKSEDYSSPSSDFASRIGLNLGGRTYFSSEDDFMNRLYRRTRPSNDQPTLTNAPRCQAEGCAADLSHSKHYHRRHKVCEFHSKASTVIAHGLTQRFCQQCSRFHLLTEFDNGKRSCRKRLADHNRRRRKTQHTNQENHTSQVQPAPNSSSDNVARSPPDSEIYSSSVVTVAVSPPRMALDCFRQRPYQGAATTTSSGSSSSLFFSSGN